MMDGKTTEFKQEYVEDIKYTAVAFANTDGGKFTSASTTTAVFRA